MRESASPTGATAALTTGLLDLLIGNALIARVLFKGHDVNQGTSLHAFPLSVQEDVGIPAAARWRAGGYSLVQKRSKVANLRQFCTRTAGTIGAAVSTAAVCASCTESRKEGIRGGIRNGTAG